MRVRLLAAIAVIMVLGVVATPFALAADGDGGTSAVSAVVPGGTRSLTASTAVVMVGARPTFSAGYTLAVAEVSRNGTNPWSVTGTLSNLVNGAVTLTPSNVAVSARAVEPTYTLGSPLGTVDATITGSEALSATRTLFRINGEDANVGYTATFAASGTLTFTVPATSPSGAYTGTLTYTLVQ